MKKASLLAIVHSFLAILAGFVAMAALVGITTLALTRFAPRFVGDNRWPRLPYMLFNLTFSGVYAAMGGWLTARMVPLSRNPLTHALVLALVVLLMGAISAVQLRGQQPLWYQIVLTALTPMAVLLGGLLRMHQLGFAL